MYSVSYVDQEREKFYILSDSPLQGLEKADLVKRNEMGLHIVAVHTKQDVILGPEEVPDTFSRGFHRVLAMDMDTLRNVTNETLWSVLSAEKRFFTDPALDRPIEGFSPADLMDEDDRRIGRVYYLAGGIFLLKADGKDAVFMGLERNQLLQYYGAKRMLFSYQPSLFCAKCHKSRGGSEGITLAMCSRCKTAFYCSRDCQSSHWKEHSGLCSKIATLNQRGMGTRKPQAS